MPSIGKRPTIIYYYVWKEEGMATCCNSVWLEERRVLCFLMKVDSSVFLMRYEGTSAGNEGVGESQVSEVENGRKFWRT